MTSTEKILKVARKWQEVAAIGRKGISHLSTRRFSKKVSQGHFVVCSVDKRRYAIPLACLDTYILPMSKEEFGLLTDGAITMPFDATIIEYTISLTGRGLAKDLERDLLHVIYSGHCSWSASSYQGCIGQQLIVC
ncbi:hypothetical protein BT93_F0190 [Corymbia citriodora subsp. variegata]|nr:hypothetical protein BT93_F0190 [Corymbia citriodora subsp. variegata]